MSQVRANEVANAAGTGPAALLKQWASKCWANFDGTGTVAIRDSRNVSALVDNGTGQYRLTMINALTNALYGQVFSARAGGALLAGGETSPAPISSAFSVGTLLSNTAAYTDSSVVTAAIHGDVA